MRYAKKIHTFRLDPGEQVVAAGNFVGQIQLFHADSLALFAEYQAHAGVIESIAYHPRQPFVASMGVDNTVVLWRRRDDERLERLFSADLHHYAAAADGYDYPAHRSQSTALCFHPHERRLVTRNYNGALLELAFEATGFRERFCRGHFRDDAGVADELLDAQYDLEYGVIVCTGSRGCVGLVDLEAPHDALATWRVGAEGAHMAEPLGDGKYMVAVDTRQVFLLDLASRAAPVAGPKITRDHLEQVSYNPTSGRAFLTGFDRTVHEVCTRTGSSLGIVAHLPFKCRWLHSVKRDPDILFVQCRNGALYKLSLAEKRLLAEHRETPMSLWYGAESAPGVIEIGGEGSEVLELDLRDVDLHVQETRPRATWTRTGADPGTFTKRVVSDPRSRRVLHGRSNGDLLVSDSDGRRILTNVGSAIRDLALAPAGEAAYLVCEDGHADKVDLRTGDILARYAGADEEPLWALALNPERDTLAVFERMGEVQLLRLDDLSVQASIDGSKRPKRALWRGADHLFASMGNLLVEYDFATREHRLRFSEADNTIEDFAWSHDGRYFAFITYDSELWLCDGDSLRALSVANIDLDYPHGMMWLDPARCRGAFPYELITMGRSGVVHHFRVQDRRVYRLGELNAPLYPERSYGVVLP